MTTTLTVKFTSALLGLLTLTVALLGGPAPANAVEAVEFSGPYEGTFAIVGQPGRSQATFDVKEVLTGTTTLGPLGLVTQLRNNTRAAPPGCPEGSSRAAGGKGVLTLTDGDLRLHRTGGVACFQFPLVDIVEQWVIVGGTGAYIGATGHLERTGTGNVLTGQASGLIAGTWVLY